VESLQEDGLPALLELAARLNVESYLLDRLGASQRRLGPGAVRHMDELRRRVAAAAVDNLKRDAELSEALAALAAEGVEAILLKGAAMRASRQGMAGRFQCDVDVLLRREDVERAESLLTGLGFQLDESYLDRENLLRSHFHLGFERRGAVVEVHWDIDSSSPSGFVDRLWRASREAGPGERVLSPEHQLLFGCLHLSRHAFHGGLRWLADLRLQLPVDPEVAQRFESEARAWPERAVRCPRWVLADHGIQEAAALGGDGGADSMDRTLLRRFIVPLLVAEPWLGVPAWRVEKALRAWLFSDRSQRDRLKSVRRQDLLGALARSLRG
jgi:hypothetical protein